MWVGLGEVRPRSCRNRQVVGDWKELDFLVEARGREERGGGQGVIMCDNRSVVRIENAAHNAERRTKDAGQDHREKVVPPCRLEQKKKKRVGWMGPGLRVMCLLLARAEQSKPR